MLSYELTISIILVMVFLFVGSLSVTEVVKAQEDVEIWFIGAAGPLSVI
jgi:NADH:ubiquinone oxidoreductase subunit H